MEKYETRTKARTEKFTKVLEKKQPTLTIVLENVHDPHNVSAVLRSCDAVGIIKVYLVYNGQNEYPRLGKASSASAKKWIKTQSFENIKDCYKQLREEGYKIFATHMSKDAGSLYDLDLTDKVALVFGNEHAGCSEDAYTLADGNFLIPQMGLIQSLNISVACAVSVYEALRQRKVAGMYDKTQLDDSSFEEMKKDWLSK